MRADIQYDGVRLTRVMPVAWIVTFVLGVLIHGLAAAGVPLSHMGLQSTILVTLFFGGLALVGTVQKLGEYTQTGRRGSASLAAGVFVTAMLATIAYGLWSYL